MDGPGPPDGDPPPLPAPPGPSITGTEPKTKQEESSKRRRKQSVGDGSTNVRVSCRFRPANRLERDQGARKCVTFTPDGKSVAVQVHGRDAEENQEDANNMFTFDQVFSDEASQVEVYGVCAKPLVEDVLEGYNCTIFAYGQTGSGKTHTMMGPDGGEFVDNRELAGIVPRIAEDIFVAMREADAENEFMIKVSFVEIYMERIRDLLNPKKSGSNLRIREDREGGISLDGVQEMYVSSPGELLKVAAKGSACRAIASTRMNQDSSRSHSVFMITITQRNTRTMQSKTGKLFLVDLAGSEMVKKTGATDSVLEEAKMINRSLSALGNVIKALVQNSKHIPYRDSKLTRLLQNSLGGNSKTSLIITCSCFSYNVTETLSTLRFGTRAKRIKNKPKVNQEFSIAEYKEMLKDAKQTIRALGSYARKLESKLGVQETASPVRSHSKNGSLVFTMSQKADTTEDDNQVPVNESLAPGKSAKRADILKRAEEALTIALETSESLRIKLEERQAELNVEKEALDGARKQNNQLEAQLGESFKERAELVQKLADLEFAKQQADYEHQEMKLTIESLEHERDILKNDKKSQVNPISRRSTREGDEDEDQQSLTKEELLRRDLETITNKYISLRLDFVEMQESLSTDVTKDDLFEKLRTEKEQRQEFEARLVEATSRLQVAQNNEQVYRMKMQNRENQIQFLEEALRDYQITFKTNVEEYHDKIAQMQAEILRYKRLLDEFENQSNDEADTPGSITSNESKNTVYKIVPRVIKPVRGEREDKKQAAASADTTTRPRRMSEISVDTKEERMSTAMWLMNKFGRLSPNNSNEQQDDLKRSNSDNAMKI